MAILTLTDVAVQQGRPPLHSRILPHGNLGNNLTACYLFNSAPSNYLVDSSVFRHHSRTIQNPTNEYWIPSEDGKVLLLFEGAAQRIDCGFIPKLNGSKRATIAAWVKLRDASSRASVGKGGFNLDVLDDGFTYLGMDGVYARFPNTEPTPKWQFITFTFNGEEPNNSNRIRGYKNGLEQELDLNGSFPSQINNDQFAFFFINYSTELGVYGSSYYKFAAVWDRVLSDDEVYQLYEDQDYSWLTTQNYIKFGRTFPNLGSSIVGSFESTGKSTTKAAGIMSRGGAFKIGSRGTSFARTAEPDPPITISQTCCMTLQLFTSINYDLKL